MKTIKLISLEIQNFQGIKYLKIDFNGCDAKIRGDNGTGKTTVKSAFNWLLFGKNAEGKADFGIKPTDADGNVIHRLETSVEAMFEVDGNPKQFKRTLTESWVRKRGAATESFTGNETGYFVNTVPKKKTEFMVEINNLINEDLFKMITDPLYFNQIAWKDRREMIIDVCGNVSEDDVFMQDAELLPLKAELNGRTIDEYKSMLTADMKAINKELSIIPSQIHEAELAKPTSTDAVDVQKKQALEKDIEYLEGCKREIISGADITRLQAERRRLEGEINRLSNPIYDSPSRETIEIKELEQEKIKKDIEVNMITIKIERCEEWLKSADKEIERLQAEYQKVFDLQFVSTACPTCGQDFPAERLAESRKAFNTDRAMKLEAIQTELDETQSEKVRVLNKMNGHLDEKIKLLEIIEQIEEYIKTKTAESKSAEEAYRAEKEKTISELKKKLSDVCDSIANFNTESEDRIKAIDEKIQALNSELQKIRTIEAGIEIEKRQEARIRELTERQTFLSKTYMDEERRLALAERFVITKVRMLNEKINNHFKYANFKLFEQNINGGIEETCEVTYKGIPFKDLNTAGRINIGLDIINTLCRKHGVVAPIFIDNAEAVTKFIETDSQKILLVVDEAHKELYVEVEKEF